MACDRNVRCSVERRWLGDLDALLVLHLLERARVAGGPDRASPDVLQGESARGVTFSRCLRHPMARVAYEGSGWGALTMWTNVGIFVVGLLIGAYLTASYSTTVNDGLQRMHVPLLGHHSTMMGG